VSETGDPRAGRCRPAEARAAALAGLPAPLKDEISGAVAGDPVHVRRLDREDAGYFLVPLLYTGRMVALAEIDAENCALSKAAAIRDSAAGTRIDAAAARRAAGAPADAAAWLGWQPCRESWDSFLPFWVVETSRGPVYVDQSGMAHRRLTTSARGG